MQISVHHLALSALRLEMQEADLVTRFLHQFVIHLSATFFPFLGNIGRSKVAYFSHIQLYISLYVLIQNYKGLLRHSFNLPHVESDHPGNIFVNHRH